jgi:hypothetical protein
MGDASLAQEWRKLEEDFRESVSQSVALAQQAYGIDYLPGCVELGDFDSTSSTILISPVDEMSIVRAESIDATFDRYWKEFQNRAQRDDWDACTPYELRHVGTFVRLRKKDRAWAVLNWFFQQQRPTGWREWAEVVWRERDTPKMIGDMPHTWCGSDFLSAARAMFVYEDERNQRVILLAGVPDAWFDEGVGVEHLPTMYGEISLTAHLVQPNRMEIRVTASAAPAGGFEMKSPLDRPMKQVTINGAATTILPGNGFRFSATDAKIEIGY